LQKRAQALQLGSLLLCVRKLLALLLQHESLLFFGSWLQATPGRPLCAAGASKAASEAAEALRYRIALLRSQALQQLLYWGTGGLLPLDWIRQVKENSGQSEESQQPR
jgi:hypothetical protein